MELRRAILLFAVILGISALVSSLVNPPAERGQRPQTGTDAEQTEQDAGGKPATGEATGKRGSDPLEVLRFGDSPHPSTKSVPLGSSVELVVEVDAAGQVTVDGLGLTQPAEPLTPARFYVLAERAGRYPISFAPASGAADEQLGTLVLKVPRDDRAAPDDAGSKDVPEDRGDPR